MTEPQSVPTLLRITLRRVGPDVTERYQRAWQHLQREASRRDIRAWVFASLETPGLYVEFAECRNPDLTALSSALQGADAALDDIAPAQQSGMWEEWNRNDEGK